MTTITRTIRATYPNSIRVLRALASITDLHINFLLNDNVNTTVSPFSITYIVNTANTFNHTSSFSISHGIQGCSRSIAKSRPESHLYGFCSGLAIQSCIDCWIETSSSILFNIAYVLPDYQICNPFYNQQVTHFIDAIENHLLSHRQTFLIGEYATAADVVVAILLHDAVERLRVKEIPEQTWRWILSICLNDLVLKGIGEKNVVENIEIRNFSPKSIALSTFQMVLKEETTYAGTLNSKGGFNSDCINMESRTNVVLENLSQLAISHKTYQHPQCRTLTDLIKNFPLPNNETHVKTIFFEDKKHGKVLVTAHVNSIINTKDIGRSLNLQGKVNLRLANEKTVMDHFSVTTDCLGPLCILNMKNPTSNTNKDSEKLMIVLDEKLMLYTYIHSYPLVNTFSIALSPNDLIRFIKGVGFNPVVVAFKCIIDDNVFTSTAAVRNKEISRTGNETVNRVYAKKNTKEAKLNKTSLKIKKQSRKGETLLALQWKKNKDFSKWYTDVLTLSEMISYYDISGCYILRPWAYEIWEIIRLYVDTQIKSFGVENAYFPLFVSKNKLEKESTHLDGFAPEVAWVTRSGPDNDDSGTLQNPVAIRPTSETIIYPAFSDWIMSHRDLPLKINQWSNVVRWEFKDPTPFLRSREFLWQEGHTAHTSYNESKDMVLDALELYRQVYEDLLAVPVIPGYKTEKEKFAGGDTTTTVEAYIPASGRAIQGATSHNLGQTFGKMFDISYQDETGVSQIPWQTSWGLTTRSIGVMVMIHGDDIGLVLPPRIAPIQVVIVPIVSKRCKQEVVNPYCDNIFRELSNNNIRVHYDNRPTYNPGWKYNHWEQKGVPIRVEVGPRDIDHHMARLVLRTNNEKLEVNIDTIGSQMIQILEQIQHSMLQKATKIRNKHLVQITEWKDFVPNLEKHNLVLTPWCGGEYQEWEEWVKETSRKESLVERGLEENDEDERTATSVAAKTLCIPFTQPELGEGMKCIASQLPAKCWCLWGRSY